MIKKLFISFVIIFQLPLLSSDDLTTSLIEEFKNAGIDLRLDRDEVLMADLKIFDGYVKDESKAFNCGIKSVTGTSLERNTLVFFQIRENGEMRQVYLGHVVLKRRYRQTSPEDQPGWRVLVSAEDRMKGIRLCTLTKNKK